MPAMHVPGVGFDARADRRRAEAGNGLRSDESAAAGAGEINLGRAMAWNPSPKVQAARDFDKKFDSPIVVILSVDIEKETLSVVSYGRTQVLCATARELSSVAYGAIMKHFAED